MSASALPPLAREITQAGLDWLYRTEQDLLAQLACNGPYAVLGDLRWSLDPRPWSQQDSRTRNVRRGNARPMIELSRAQDQNALSTEVVDAFAELVAELGYTIHNTHLQPDRSAVGLVLDEPMHPTLCTAVVNWDYYACPDHEDQRPYQCRDSGTCEWGARSKLMIYPSWPVGVDDHGIG